MMNKIKPGFIFAGIIFFLSLLSGCLNYEQITTIKKDHSGVMYIHYWVDWKAGQDTSFYSNSGLFAQDTIRSRFDYDFLEVNEINMFINYSDSTRHAQINIAFDDIQRLNETKPFKGANFSIVESPGGTERFSQFIPAFFTGYNLDGKNFTIQYTYYLPGKILDHNADVKERNKLIWESDLATIKSGKFIYAVYVPFKLKETPVWVYILASIVLMVVLVYLFSKKK